ncbi:hypothetical protein HYT23_02390 [Candidatus Pacearchaeota archaeon]|nr:hypothetical protein [Candidatus Pacearchaeota archaeon]
MIEGGKGGARTLTGLNFERKADLKQKFEQIKDYGVKGDDLFYRGRIIASFYGKYELYNKLLLKYNIRWEDKISKRWLPDEAILVLTNNTLFIIEMKFQKVGGSVDEKLQTCDFKKKTYQKLLSGTGIKVEYCYILSKWFMQKQYKDTLDYIEFVGCKFFFERLPLRYLGLPDPNSP